MTARKLLLATSNPGKVREFRQLFSDVPGIELVVPAELGAMPEVVEDGDTFEHNAKKKASELASWSGLLVLADDSGLEVDALGGRPGVHSARYAGPGANDQDNNDKLVRELASVPVAERSARYRVVLALADPRGEVVPSVHVESGACEGHIELEPRGENGFGYDPYFAPRGYECRMAELPSEEKNRISHRAEAARKMRAFLLSAMARERE